MCIAFRIRNHVVQHGSVESLQKALYTTQANMRVTAAAASAERSEVLCYQSDAATVLYMAIKALDVGKIDEQLQVARLANRDLYEDRAEAWDGIAGAIGPIRDRLGGIEALLVPARHWINELIPRPISRYPSRARTVEDDLICLQKRASEGPETLEVVRTIAAGSLRDLARYQAMLPLGVTPPDAYRYGPPMHVKPSHLMSFIEQVETLADMPELKQLQDSADAFYRANQFCNWGGWQNAFDIFDESIGRLPIWQHIDEGLLWPALAPALGCVQVAATETV